MFLIPFARSIEIMQHEEKAFVSWMREHNKMFVGDEYAFRLGIYLSNARFIREFNQGHASFKVAENLFSASTPSEYRAYLTKPQKPVKRAENTPLKLKYDPLPDDWDWREKGVVSPIRDQAGCGSGWAFASAACQESTWAIYRSQLNVLSVSNLIDCDWQDEGCYSGSADGASYYVLKEQNGLWMAESDYPYRPQEGQCKFDANKAIESFSGVHYTRNETDMAHHVAEYGVLSCAYDGSLMSFEYYYSGVYDDDQCDPWDLCHCMLVVGYGTDSGKDYWLVKNSFGTTWGIKGYGEMIRNKNGQCGIDLLTFAHILPDNK